MIWVLMMVCAINSICSETPQEQNLEKWYFASEADCHQAVKDLKSPYFGTPGVECVQQVPSLYDEPKTLWPYPGAGK